MSIRTDDLGFVFYEADEQEEKELEYVYAITDSWNYMGDEVIDTFPTQNLLLLSKIGCNSL